ncbi:nitrate ABC transporter substrate-binding protein [Cnuibacter physcomitrellae]|uniref:Nitrate ABC transporter substrate-binding protein n=1 Tax=Cnuibacter physcomitrellae TaxID=1619308 RepID=A0A1X9LMW7_9MICO|nr:nitrate ABC transporter substrate-binding protein [Cnuibacter physcomitrellae]ARJ05822.1 nitrate ABC transporter substrate-binding protein [Cnuibacter physcomitrellae]MCS5496449.1 ABC transporter substrate-binding protein [Cnuibacter physcomitrellae]GGI36566.1 nitrate ABC transporter substrate-binding protein [Cnuibacter physcomitrellae]
MRSTRSRLVIAAGLAAATAVALSACSGGSSSSESTASADLTVGSVDLAAAGCPATVVIQTDWNPEAEHGHLYQMLGPGYTVDAQNKSVSGPLMSKGEYTGVNVEVRSGGPAIGFQQVSTQMYTDQDIMLGYVTTDESVLLSQSAPTTAVFAPLDISPLMIMWDPATYPDAKTVQDVVAKGAVVRYFGGSAYMEYLNSVGTVPTAQSDGSYDGTPASFVASGGKDAQQGFASAEPYIYENEVESWMKPVKYELVNDLGYEAYQSAMVVRSGDLEKDSGCLKALVPVLQQAEVDYFADPAPVNTMILDLVKQFDTGWVYSQGVADYSVKTMIDEGIVGNGPNSTIGDFDDARMKTFYDAVSPVFEKLGTPPADGLTVDDIYTNEFIDTSIGLPAK